MIQWDNDGKGRNDQMKKWILGLIMTLTLGLSGCSYSEINNAFEAMNELTSYKMDIVVEILNLNDVVLERIESTARVDDNYQIITVERTTVIILIELDGVLYQYVDKYDLPFLDVYMDEEEYNDFGLYLGFHFERDGDYYVLQGDVDFLDETEEVKVKVEDGYVTKMVIKGIMDDTPVRVSINYSEYDEVDLTPNVYLPFDVQETILDFADSTGYTWGYSEDWGFMLGGDNVTTECMFENNVCTIGTNPETLYSPIYETIAIGDLQDQNYMPYAQWVEENEQTGITIEVFEMINYLYAIYQD